MQVTDNQDISINNYTMSEFGDAFKKARQSGLSTFEYNGKKYGTRLGSETKEQHAKYLAGKSELRRSISQETGKNTGYKGEMKAVKSETRKPEKKVELAAKKAPSVVKQPKAAPAAKKESTAPRSGSAVSQSRQNESTIAGLKDEAMAKRATADKAKKSSAANEKMVGKKPGISITKDSREGYIAKRKKAGRKASATDYERSKAMNKYAEDRKKVKGVADKYKNVLDRAAKLFGKGGKMY